MTNDELRALADALHWVQYTADWQACDQAADYLRAQADAQPVAWRDHVEQRIRGWRQRTMNRSGDRLALDDMMGQDTIDDLIDYVCDEWAAPAAPQAEPDDDALVLGEPDMLTPEDVRRAVPQAEPIADSDADYWLRNRRPILDAIERAGFVLMSNASGFWLHPRGTTDAQAESKRDWTAVDAAIREYLDDYELIGEDDAGADAYYTPTERELYLIYDAINGLLADENFVTAISTRQAEPKREPTCLWSRADDDTDVWETSCGHAFTIIDGTPGDNHMEFCCYCGRPLEQESSRG